MSDLANTLALSAQWSINDAHCRQAMLSNAMFKDREELRLPQRRRPLLAQ